MCKLDTSCLLSNDGGWYASVKENSARAPGEFVRLLKVAFFIYFFLTAMCIPYFYETGECFTQILYIVLASHNTQKIDNLPIF